MSMHPLLNDARDIRIVQQTGRVTSKVLDPVDSLLLVLPERARANVWRSLPQGAKLHAAARRRTAGAVPALAARLANKRQTLVVGGMLAASSSAFEQLSFARKLVAAATAEKAGCLGICVHGFDDEAQANEKDIVLRQLPADRKVTLYARRLENTECLSYHFDIRMQGADETLFFDI